jgi:hypothetical protein
MTGTVIEVSGMAEYIEREALLAEYDRVHVGPPGGARKLIEVAPAADVVPVVHGRWVQVICHVEFEDGFVDRLYECCSRCHEPNGRKATNYCPNCGARMDGE